MLLLNVWVLKPDFGSDACVSTKCLNMFPFLHSWMNSGSHLVQMLRTNVLSSCSAAWSAASGVWRNASSSWTGTPTSWWVTVTAHGRVRGVGFGHVSIKALLFFLQIAIYGKGFCPSARDAFFLLMRNIVRWVFATLFILNFYFYKH